MKNHIDALKDITSALIEKSLAREKFEKRKDVLIEILTTLNFLDNEEQSVLRLLDIIQSYTNVEAVGLRLQRGGDYPYLAYKGFSEEFVELENSLRCKETIFDISKEELECMCGYVVLPKDKSSYPFFTEFGSFFTGDGVGLLEGKYGPLPIDTNIRGVCLKNGYQTIAMVPLKCKSDRIIGILQLNDKRKDALSLETIHFFEGIGLNIGVALSRIRLMENLKERCINHGRSIEGYELQFNRPAT
jgi:hypothetical protein